MTKGFSESPADNMVKPIPQRMVQVGFANDFKSCALWTMIGLLGGVMVGIWLCKKERVF